MYFPAPLASCNPPTSCPPPLHPAPIQPSILPSRFHLPPPEGFAPAEMFREEFLFWRDDLRVRLDRPLGHGFFGMVFLGELARGGAATRVAVKTHGEAASADEILQFLKEAALMQ